MHSTSLSSQTLHEHSNSHTRRESVWVDDNIRLHSTFTEWHIDSWELLRANTLLTMSRGEFVSDDRRTRDSQFDVDFLSLDITGVTT